MSDSIIILGEVETPHRGKFIGETKDGQAYGEGTGKDYHGTWWGTFKSSEFHGLCKYLDLARLNF